MKRIFQFVENLFSGTLGKVLVISNFIVCYIIFSFGKSLRIIEKTTTENQNFISKPSIDFNIYHQTSSIFDPILGFFDVLYYIFFYPSIVFSEKIVGIIENLFPHWHWNIFDTFYMIIFTLINTFYWLFLGDTIEILYSFKLEPKKPLSILAD